MDPAELAEEDTDGLCWKYRHCDKVAEEVAIVAEFNHRIAAAEERGRRAERAKFVADVRTHLLCDCGDIYTSRGMIAPDCPWHSYAIELLTEEEFAIRRGESAPVAQPGDST